MQHQQLRHKVLVAVGVLLIIAGLAVLWPRTHRASWMIGIRKAPNTIECYRLGLASPSRVAVQEQFVVTGMVTAVGWGLRQRPHVTLQLSAAGMEIAPGNTMEVFATSPKAETSSVRWSARPLSAGRFRLVVNVGSGSHPLEFIDTDGTLPVEVYAPWTTIISPYTGALMTFLGSLATLPGILQYLRERRQKKAA